MRYFSSLFLVFLVTVSFYVEAQGPDQFFQKKNLVETGVYYYPEQWPEEQWERDIRKIASLGFEFTHFAEFSWSRLEPSEGKYDFSWLDKAIDLAARNGLKVILCTPSATPPAWLSYKYPQILMVNEEGRTMQHGSRQFASWSDEIYKRYVGKIVMEMARHYGNDKRIWGWQIDNEPSHYSYPYDYSQAAVQNFRLWLNEKYKNIKNLNKAWGNAFWSQEYNNFEQIRIPLQKETVQPVNPHALLDFQLFTNEELGKFIGMQVGVLKSFIKVNQFVTTNYNNNLPHFDPFQNKADLDFASYTFYPVNSWSGDAGGELGFRLGAGLEHSFFYDFCRSVNGMTGPMELQPGQVNWGRYNSQPYPGAVRMWLWHAFAMGAPFICTYRFRQPLFGNEQYHNGIMQTDGVTLSRGGEEFVQAIGEFKQLREKYKELSKDPDKSGKTAILWDQKSMLDIKNFPHTAAWDGMRHLFNYYKALKSFGLEVKFVQYKDNLDPLQIPSLIIPSIQLVDKEFMEKLKNYVQKGGNLVITCRTAQKDRNGHLWEATLQEPLYSLIGAKVLFNDHLPFDRKGKLRLANEELKWDTWGEVLELTDTSGVFFQASYDDQFYKGKQAIISRKLGKGLISFVGTVSANGDLEKNVLKKIFQARGIKTEDLPDYVFHEYRDGFHIICNYSSQIFHKTLQHGTRIIFGSADVAPGAVLVWSEDAQ